MVEDHLAEELLVAVVQEWVVAEVVNLISVQAVALEAELILTLVPITHCSALEILSQAKNEQVVPVIFLS